MAGEAELVREIAELSARIKQLERWQEQWRYRKRRVRKLQSDAGYVIDTERGLAANFHQEVDPPDQSYPVGDTLLGQWVTDAGYWSILPVTWTFPAQVGNLRPKVTFTMSDGSTVTRSNPTGSGLRESHALDMEFDQHGQTVVLVEFYVENTGGSPESGDLGLFTLDGWQV